jgi:beta-glucanase (GH16 family)
MKLRSLSSILVLATALSVGLQPSAGAAQLTPSPGSVATALEDTSFTPTESTESYVALYDSLNGVQAVADNPNAGSPTILAAANLALSRLNTGAADILGNLRGGLTTTLTQVKFYAEKGQTLLARVALSFTNVASIIKALLANGKLVLASCDKPGVTKADGSPWTCSFFDEFSGTSVDTSKWLILNDHVPSGEPPAYACYTSNNVSVGSGSLNLVVRSEPASVPCVNQKFGATAPYSAGAVATHHIFAQKYGRFEARVKTQATNVPGLQEAFWLWPDDTEPQDPTNALPWPQRGEIDIAETYSQYPNLAIPFLHYNTPTVTQGSDTAYNCIANRGQYNTYTMVWEPNRIQIDINGKPCVINTSGDPSFQKPYFITMSVLLGVGPNKLQAGTPLPATTNVDYIRVWK